MISNSGMLQKLRCYLDIDIIIINDSSTHAITHVGDT